MLAETQNWGESLQIFSDLILTNGRTANLKSFNSEKNTFEFEEIPQPEPNEEPIEFHIANPDYDYKALYIKPR